MKETWRASGFVGYISSDPIGLSGGINSYTYVDNNPLGDVDPIGLSKGGSGSTSNNNTRGPYIRPTIPSMGASYSPRPITIYTGGPQSCGMCFEIYAVIPIQGASRSSHRRSALRDLEQNLQSNQALRKRLDKECGCDTLGAMRSGNSGGLRNPPGFELHHPVGMPGYVWLIRRCDHRNPLLQDFFHPRGIGGYGEYYGR